MSVINQHILTIPATTGRLSQVRKFATAHARAFGFGEADVEEIRLAIDEACTNVIKHAYENDSTQKIKIKLEVKNNQFLITITDHGNSFDPKTYVHPNVEEQTKKRERGGLGVFLMRKFMDKVEYRNTGKMNELRMMKSMP